jgi:hypothetical protein
VIVEFMDNDKGYVAWLAEHPDGFVLNCERPPTTVVPDLAPSDVLDHQQGVGYQLDCELSEGLRRHVRGNQRLGRADRIALELRLLRA